MSDYGPYRATVVNVHDGDTVTLQIELGFGLSFFSNCRIFGINAPELSTDAGKKARDYAKTLLPVGTLVQVISHGWDKYGNRFDGEIDINGLDFGGAMIHAGQAVPYSGGAR